MYKYIALHHTADPSMDMQIHRVDRYHKQKWGMKSSKGWYVGYNYFCERNGSWTNTREVGEETIANRGHNCDVPERCDTISFCMAGDFRTQEPTELQTAMFTSFVNNMRTLYGQDLQVVGHRDLGSTSCPAVEQSYIDKFNRTHSLDQLEKAVVLDEVQSKIDRIREILDKIMRSLGLK